MKLFVAKLLDRSFPGLTIQKPFQFSFKNVLARATITGNAVGEVVIFQEDWKKSAVVLIALTNLNAGAAGAVTVDVRTSSDVSAACVNQGAVFNPTGVSTNLSTLPPIVSSSELCS